MQIQPGIVAIYVPAHGYYGSTAADVDALIARYLPASVDELRALLYERAESYEIDYSDVRTKIELLLILGEYDGVTAI